MHWGSGVRREEAEPDPWQRFADRRGMWLVTSIAFVAGTVALSSVDPLEPPGPAFLGGWVVAAAAGIWLNFRLGREMWNLSMRHPIKAMVHTSRLAYTPPRSNERTLTGWLGWTACCLSSVAYVVTLVLVFVRFS